MSSGPLFGLVPAGQPLITEPASAPSPTSFLYALPTTKPFNHIVVLLLPGVALPAGAAAAIYLATAAAPSSFRFLGAIGPGKESAIFNVKHTGTGAGDGGGLVIGVELESEEAVAQRMQELAASKNTTTSDSTSSQPQPSTVVLAQRIIQNAFNFLTSFSGTAGPGGVEVVPLKAFEEWWRKFESRVRADPSFLERQAD
jgi:hypothetical protein